MAKGRPPVKVEEKMQKAQSWGVSGEDISSQKLEDFMATPALKKQRTITKKLDVENFDF